MTAQEILDRFGWVPYCSEQPKNVNEVVVVKEGYGLIAEGTPLRLIAEATAEELEPLNQATGRHPHPSMRYFYKAVAE